MRGVPCRIERSREYSERAARHAGRARSGPTARLAAGTVGSPAGASSCGISSRTTGGPSPSARSSRARRGRSGRRRPPRRIGMLDGYLTVDLGSWHFHLCIGEHRGTAANPTPPALARHRRTRRAELYRRVNADGAPDSWGLRLLNGHDEQQLTVLLPNPFLGDHHEYLPAPDWSRLALWDHLRDIISACRRTRSTGRARASFTLDHAGLDHLQGMIAALVSALHLLALALGLPSVYFRGRALRGRLDADGFKRLFIADSVWGIAAALWLVTGLLRAVRRAREGHGVLFRLDAVLDQDGPLRPHPDPRDLADDDLPSLAHRAAAGGGARHRHPRAASTSSTTWRWPWWC